jgi:DNA-directed RNA polymerase sigma subunit (sigma70/sigma32)
VGPAIRCDRGQGERLRDSIARERTSAALRCRRERRKLRAQLHRDPTLSEIAADLNVAVDTVELLQTTSRTPLSLARQDDGDHVELGDLLADDQPSHDEALATSAVVDVARDALHILQERERVVIDLSFGLTSYKPVSLAEIGRQIGLTPERIRQIEQTALERLAALPELQALCDVG